MAACTLLASRHAAPTVKPSGQQLRIAIVLVEPQANEDA